MAVVNWNAARHGGFSFRHDAVGTNWTILNPGAAATALPTFTTGEALEILSSSEFDIFSGNGAKQVQAIYLDTDGSLDSATITMNGTAAVALADTTIARMLDIHVMAYGASGPSLGNITVRVASGGANRIQIQTGFSRAAPGRKTVQTSYAEFYKGFSLTCAGLTGTSQAEIRVLADVNPSTGALNEGVFQEIDWAFATQNGGQVFTAYHGSRQESSRRLELPAKATIMVMGKMNAAPVGLLSGFVFLERELVLN